MDLLFGRVDELENLKLKSDEKFSEISQLSRNFEKALLRISTLESSLAQANAKILLGENAQEQLSKTISSGITALTGKITEVEAKAVTSVEFTSVEGQPLWKGGGYSDSQGYVITGVIKWNSDNFPDWVYRRRLRVQKNGRWSFI